jgi:hypothetical protein
LAELAGSHIIPFFFLKNSMAWVREWTTPLERLPLVGKVSAHFCGYRVPRRQRDRSLRA